MALLLTKSKQYSQCGNNSIWQCPFVKQEPSHEDALAADVKTAVANVLTHCTAKGFSSTKSDLQTAHGGCRSSAAWRLKMLFRLESFPSSFCRSRVFGQFFGVRYKIGITRYVLSEYLGY